MFMSHLFFIIDISKDKFLIHYVNYEAFSYQKYLCYKSLHYVGVCKRKRKHMFLVVVFIFIVIFLSISMTASMKVKRSEKSIDVLPSSHFVFAHGFVR